jgi:cyanate permease
MTASRILSRPRAATVAGMLMGALGIALLWASGRIRWPIYPPPGIVNLLIGALLVVLVPRRWAPAVGAAMGSILLVGFLLSGGPPNLVGHKGTTVATGNWLMILGGCTAMVAGVRATRTEQRRPARRRR